MASIHIIMSGVELGPYSEDQVRRYLEEGFLRSVDLARLEGVDQWSAVSDLLAALPPPPPPPDPEPAEGVKPARATASIRPKKPRKKAAPSEPVDDIPLFGWQGSTMARAREIKPVQPPLTPPAESVLDSPPEEISPYPAEPQIVAEPIAPVEYVEPEPEPAVEYATPEPIIEEPPAPLPPQKSPSKPLPAFVPPLRDASYVYVPEMAEPEPIPVPEKPSLPPEPVAIVTPKATPTAPAPAPIPVVVEKVPQAVVAKAPAPVTPKTATPETNPVTKEPKVNKRSRFFDALKKSFSPTVKKKAPPTTKPKPSGHLTVPPQKPLAAQPSITDTKSKLLDALKEDFTPIAKASTPAPVEKKRIPSEPAVATTATKTPKIEPVVAKAPTPSPVEEKKNPPPEPVVKATPAPTPKVEAVVAKAPTPVPAPSTVAMKAVAPVVRAVTPLTTPAPVPPKATPVETKAVKQPPAIESKPVPQPISGAPKLPAKPEAKPARKSSRHAIKLRPKVILAGIGLGLIAVTYCVGSFYIEHLLLAATSGRHPLPLTKSSPTLAIRPAEPASSDAQAETNPRTSTDFYKRALIKQGKGDLDGAMIDFNRALDLDPQNASAYSYRGFVEQARGDTDAAVSDYTYAVQLNPKLAIAFYNRGLIKHERGDLDGAISDFDQALDADAKIAVAYYNRGLTKSQKNELDDAITDYSQAIDLDPKLSGAYYHRGLAYQAGGDLDPALNDYNLALGLDPNIAIAYYYRALIKEQESDLEGAIVDYNKAIELDPNNFQAYFNRGISKLAKGDARGAQDDLQDFCDKSPHDPYADYARLYLWIIDAQQNLTKSANQDLSTALRRNWNATPTDFVSKIAAFLLEQISEQDFLAAAAAVDAKKDQGQHCEAYYFAAVKRILAKDPTTAIDYLQKCVATEERDYCEYITAQAQLKRLDKAK